MSENGWIGSLLLLAGALLVLFILLERPWYLTDPSTLMTLIGAQVVLAAIARFRRVFFPILVLSFLWAGVALPFRGVFLQGRWIVLGTGAVVGLAVYMKDRNHYFNTFHLVAFFCTLSALISGSVSEYPEEALLKAISLMLLFIYAAAGARTALPAFQPVLFFRRMLLCCEILTYASAALYFVFRWEIYGNPNSLGAVMGVAIIPTLLWGHIIAESQLRRWRLATALLVATLLLMSSFARAAIGAAAVSCVLVCATLRQYRLLVKSAVAVALLAVIVVAFVPRNETPYWDSSEPITSIFLYKGKQEQGVLGSRRGVWGETWDAIQAHPWFGSGFGTSATSEDMTKLTYIKSHVDSWVIREHGNSYLAIAEWVGLLGVVPFYVLIGLAVINVGRAFAWLRRTGDAFSPAVPAAAIVAAGLFHATFEDWLFAVGYYLCVFFWAMAFLLVDVLPGATVLQAKEMIPIAAPRFSAAASTP